MIFLNMGDTLQPTENLSEKRKPCHLLDQGRLSFPVPSQQHAWFFGHWACQRLGLLTLLVCRLPVSDPITPLAPGLLVNRPEILGLLGSQAPLPAPPRSPPFLWRRRPFRAKWLGGGLVRKGAVQWQSRAVGLTEVVTSLAPVLSRTFFMSEVGSTA